MLPKLFPILRSSYGSLSPDAVERFFGPLQVSLPNQDAYVGQCWDTAGSIVSPNVCPNAERVKVVDDQGRLLFI
jgi:hypothetical protein